MQLTMFLVMFDQSHMSIKHQCSPHKSPQCSDIIRLLNAAAMLYSEMQVILILMADVTMINGENKAGLFVSEKGDRQVLMRTAVWQFQVRMEIGAQSIFAKVMSPFHKNMQSQSILQRNRFWISGQCDGSNWPLSFIFFLHSKCW